MNGAYDGDLSRSANTNFMMVMPTCFFGQLSACFHATSEHWEYPQRTGILRARYWRWSIMWSFLILRI
jgi:hypothetical protein